VRYEGIEGDAESIILRQQSGGVPATVDASLPTVSKASAQQWLAVFVEYYNRQRPHQALNHRTPAEEVLN